MDDSIWFHDHACESRRVGLQRPFCDLLLEARPIQAIELPLEGHRELQVRPASEREGYEWNHVYLSCIVWISWTCMTVWLNTELQECKCKDSKVKRSMCSCDIMFTSVVLVASQCGAQLEQEMSIGKLLSPCQRTGKVETSSKHTWLFKITEYY